MSVAVTTAVAAVLLVGALETGAFLSPRTTGMLSLGRNFAGSNHREFFSRTHALPKAIVFDLDGCLWTPEMYEIVYFQGGRGSPFREDPEHPFGLLTSGDEPVRLLGDVRSIFGELHRDPAYNDVRIGISSRTDEPGWARELLETFRIDDNEGGVCLADVLNGPIEIAKDSKVDHFQRIRTETGIDFPDMVFFDNEFGNCQSVAALGVSVVYCPEGVTRAVWELGIRDEFPRSDGSVINGEERGWF